MQTLAPTRRSHRVWRIIAPVVVAGAATTGCVGGGGGGAGGDAGQLLQRVNALRASSGLGPLSWCGTLANAAAAHTQDMASHGFMGHIGSDGSDFITRATRNGYVGWTRITENVAAGPGSVDAVMAMWMGSPPHAAHILDRGVHHAGFARVGNHWTQMFGANGRC